MAWTTPLTAVANATLTSAQWNASVRDNLNETAPAKFSASGQYLVSTGANAGAARSGATGSVTTTETTNATTFGDLTSGTVGPSATVTSGTRALVCIHARLVNNTAGVITAAGWTASGATTLAATDDLSIAYESSNVSDQVWTSGVWFYTAFNSGSNTIKMVYKVSSASTGSLGDRRVSVLPF